MDRYGAAAAVLSVGLVLTACGGSPPVTLGDESPSVTPSTTSTRSPTGQASDEPTRSTIPDGFPLLDGYPTDDQAEGRKDGRRGPDRTSTLVVPQACGASAEVPAHLDLLRGGWQNPEDLRERQLVLFASVDQAEEYAEAVLDVYRSCPREDTGNGYTGVTTVVDEHLADRSAVAVTRYEYGEAPAVGLFAMQVVRSGSAVLLATTYNEAGGVRAEGRRTAQEIEAVVEAMADLS